MNPDSEDLAGWWFTDPADEVPPSCTAHQLGYRAALDGYSIDANPYKIGTAERQLWTDGWRDCETETPDE